MEDIGTMKIYVFILPKDTDIKAYSNQRGQIKPTKRLVPTGFENFPPGLPYVGSITTEKYSISTTNLERTQPVFKRFHGPSLYEGQAPKVEVPA